MKIRPFKRYLSDDYRGAGQWFFDFLENLNPMIDTLNFLCQRNIDLDNNILGERQIVTLSHDVPITIKLRTLTTIPRFVRVGYAAGFVGAGAISGYNADGTLQVTVMFLGTLPTVPVSTQLYFEP